MSSFISPSFSFHCSFAPVLFPSSFFFLSSFGFKSKTRILLVTQVFNPHRFGLPLNRPLEFYSNLQVPKQARSQHHYAQVVVTNSH